jgi:hypothetical protein
MGREVDLFEPRQIVARAYRNARTRRHTDARAKSPARRNERRDVERCAVRTDACEGRRLPTPPHQKTWIRRGRKSRRLGNGVVLR